MLRNIRHLGWDSRPPIWETNILRLQLQEIYASEFIRCCFIPQNPQEVQKTEALLCSWECWRAGICCGLEAGPGPLANDAGCSPQLRLLMFWLTNPPPPPFPLSSGSSLPLLFVSLSVLLKHGKESLSDFPFLFGGAENSAAVGLHMSRATNDQMFHCSLPCLSMSR